MLVLTNLLTLVLLVTFKLKETYQQKNKPPLTLNLKLTLKALPNLVLMLKPKPKLMLKLKPKLNKKLVLMLKDKLL